MVGPYRGVLPDAAIAQIEEQLSGACTVEIAGFNEFSKFIGDEKISAGFDHIILDTAPTGHTLRLLNLPAAWNNFIAENPSGSSCLGPVSGLADQKVLFEKVVEALCAPEKTRLVLVSRAETMSFTEAVRASEELRSIGMSNQHVIINGVFTTDGSDPIAQAFAERSENAIASMPAGLQALPVTRVGFRPSGVMGISAMREVIEGVAHAEELVAEGELQEAMQQVAVGFERWGAFIDGFEQSPHGVIMTMGKGGVGKTAMAALIASELAQRGHSVLLSTTDPAAHLDQVIESDIPGLEIDRIDPELERERYVAAVLDKSRESMSAEDLQLLEEELKSPCIEEIAIFQAFARTVAKGTDRFIVLDTAPTGHTLLLLDSTQAYHREMSKATEELPAEVQALLPRIRDPQFTRIVIVALPEATPVHEAATLQEDLRRAGIEPYGWIVNRSFAASGTADPALCAKGMYEIEFLREVSESLSTRCVVSPWVVAHEQKSSWLSALMTWNEVALGASK
jgi:arsenite-transporting ATPase